MIVDPRMLLQLGGLVLLIVGGVLLFGPVALLAAGVVLVLAPELLTAAGRVRATYKVQVARRPLDARQVNR